MFFSILYDFMICIFQNIKEMVVFPPSSTTICYPSVKFHYVHVSSLNSYNRSARNVSYVLQIHLYWPINACAYMDLSYYIFKILLHESSHPILFHPLCLSLTQISIELLMFQALCDELVFSSSFIILQNPIKL